MKTRVKAYAKINLHLDVTEIREDGYHNIEGIMQSISLCDIVDIEVIENEKIIIECDKAGVPLDEKNIAYKAARRFLDKAQRSCGVIIKIKKNIPMAAGLAGGSADGAAVLVGLNELFEGALSDEELYALGASLGADVPFCMACGCCLTEGIGERMTRIESLSQDTVLVIACGGEGVSTPTAYRMLDEKYDNFKTYNPQGYADLQRCIVEGNDAFYEHIFNIFEEPIPSVRPVVGEVKSYMLECGALGAMMSGSGPSVFGVFDDIKKAEKTVSEIKKHGYFAIIAYPIAKR